MAKIINWDIFKGSSHCRDTLYDFAQGNIKLTNLPEEFLPFMPDQAREARRIKRLGLKKAKRLTRAALSRGYW